MKQISKEYCKNAKDFFPIYTSREKKYLQDLRVNIDDFCEDNHITTLNDLYGIWKSCRCCSRIFFQL